MEMKYLDGYTGTPQPLHLRTLDYEAKPVMP